MRQALLLVVPLLCLVGAADRAVCRDKRQQVSLTVGGRTGINAAQLADQIACGGGRFNVLWLGAVPVKRPLVVGEGTVVSITGLEPAGVSVVKGDRGGGLFVVRPHAELRLAHLELTGGAAGPDGDGGAVLVQLNGTLTATSCRFISNEARYGGCIRAAPNSKVRIVVCTLSNSTAQYGGAIDTDGELHCVRSAFSNNKIVHSFQLAGNGGAINGNEGSSVSVIGCNFTGSSTPVQGGAIATESRLNISSSNFNGNNAFQGGSVKAGSKSSVVVQDCTFSDEKAVSDGGAIVSVGGNVTCYSSRFMRNKAGATGGAIAVLGSDGESGGRVSLIDCTVSDSSAGKGGAVSADFGDFTCAGCDMQRNTAKENAGTLAATNTARMIITSSALAYSVAQGAGSLGGILYAAYDSGGSIYGGINSALALDGVTIHNSTAVINGGAVSAQGTLIMKASVCSDVTVLSMGGCLYAGPLSSIAVYDSSFTSARSGSLGGILYAADDAQVTLTGVTVVHSSARSGGALAVDGMLRCSNSTFTGTSAYDSGGSIYGGSNSALALDSVTIYNSTAVVNGGAISAQGTLIMKASMCSDVSAQSKGGCLHAGPLSTIAVNISSFTSATSGVGGAVAAEGNLTCHRCIFVGNFAGDTGGALATTTATQHCTTTITESKFFLNRAQRAGGAVHIGTNVLASISASNFTGNSAAAAGALFVGSGSADDVLISASTFHNNTATGGAGGAVLQEGEVLSVVVATGLGDVEFSGNSAQCCFARNYTATLGASCVDVSAGYSTDWSCCGSGFYVGTSGEDPPRPTCKQCDAASMDCSSAVGVTVATLQLRKGYWRESLSTDALRACWNPDACTGGAPASEDELDEYCAQGYSGPYCAVCTADHMHLTAYTCAACTSGAMSAVIIIATVVLVALATCALVAVLESLRYSDMSAAAGSARSAGAALRNAVCALLAALRIPLVVYQIQTQFASITGALLPEAYHTFLNWLNAISFDLRWVLPLGCAADLNFYQRLLVATLAPLGVGTLLLTPRVIVALLPRELPSGRLAARIRAKAARLAAADLKLFLVFTFVIFSGVSAIVLQTFACETLEGTGVSYLRADYSIRCQTSKHSAYMVYAGFMILVYPIGIPALYAWVLRQHRKHADILQHASSKREHATIQLASAEMRERAAIAAAADQQAAALAAEESGNARASTFNFARPTTIAALPTAATHAPPALISAVSPVSRASAFLRKAYYQRADYWECVECVRRISLTGLLVFIAPGTPSQYVAACALSFGAIVVYELVQPHRLRADTCLYTLGGVITWGSTFLAALTGGPAAAATVDGNALSERGAAAGVVLIALNVLLLVLALAMALVVGQTVTGELSGVSLTQVSSFYGLRSSGGGAASESVWEEGNSSRQQKHSDSDALVAGRPDVGRQNCDNIYSGRAMCS
eukprot:TRINITY_DN1121_c0_g1_i8.p1 TRINITY_DN1121_c0_g1~~TRINITY_DN1121_c0_g1_i8.p1  ORF type:complete len:1431 (+),score=246.26 TRINITY_DN1121_c0_g1_i8:130-4422(+)